VLLKSVIADVNSFQLPTQQDCLWADNTGVNACQWKVEITGICQEKSVLTIQQKNNTMMEYI
jgi:hypothetical protein